MKIVAASLLVSITSAALAAPEQCRKFELNGEVKGHQHFHAAIGTGNLTFRMDPGGGGWTFNVGPTDAKKGEFRDYVDWINVPRRAHRANMLNTEYGFRAQDIKAVDHHFWFPISAAEARATNAALQNETSEEHEMAVLATMKKGQGNFIFLDEEIEPGTAKPYPEAKEGEGTLGSLRRVKFKVEFFLPVLFVADRSSHGVTVPCPEMGKWP